MRMQLLRWLNVHVAKTPDGEISPLWLRRLWRVLHLFDWMPDGTLKITGKLDDEQLAKFRIEWDKNMRRHPMILMRALRP